LPDCVVHALSFGDEGPDDQELDQGFHRLRWLVQAVQRHRAEAGLRSWRLVVLTRRAAEVGGGEPVNPVRAMLLGLLRTADLEIDSLDVQLVDVGERASNDTVVEAIRLRLPVVAVRGTRVLRPALLPVADGAAQNRLRRRGVYLITGGLGALGAVCARALADTGLTPRLALVGRSGMDTPGADRLVAELTAAGAEVQVIAADIGDPTAAADVLATVRDRFGPVNGVVHAAGVAGDGLIELRTDDQVAAVLRAKVGGGRVLTDLLADEPDVDWMVHFSSRAALSGLVGSGDYAAANAYLDALARGSDDGDRRVVSVAWPAWSGAGMASGLPDAESDEVVVERTLTGEEWFLAEHRVDGVPVLSGTTYIDLLAEAVRERGLVPGDAALAVRDLKFLAPLTVPADTEVQLRLRPDGGSHRVVVRSRAAGQREWTTHAKATVAAADSAPQHVRLDVLHADWADAEPAAFGGRGLLQLGPRWDNVVRRVCRGDEQLVELRLGDAHRDDVQRHQAHPALLDNATSSVNLAGGEGPYIPVGYRELVLHQRIPADVVVVVGPVTRAGDRLTGDIDIYNQRGRHVAHITGFTMQVVPPDVFAHPAPEPAGGATGQLSPEDGAELFLRVIQSSVPAHVAVLPAGAAPVPHHVYTVAGETVVAPPPAPRPVEVAPAPVAPVTTGDVLTRLQRIWQDLVGDPEIGLDDDFFDIGGTSLSAVQLVSMVRDELGVEIGVGLIFEKSTLRDLSGELERLGAS
jgi:NAD(P)-dependent dehydrogenase (short-subunit alcohol dehydrogenase family)/acyl carrier protein